MNRELETRNENYGIFDPFFNALFGGDEDKNFGMLAMMCEGCAHRVEAALKALPGVKDVKVSLKDKNALVKVEEPLEESLYKKAIEDAGYTCTGVK